MQSLTERLQNYCLVVAAALFFLRWMFDTSEFYCERVDVMKICYDVTKNL